MCIVAGSRSYLAEFVYCLKFFMCLMFVGKRYLQKFLTLKVLSSCDTRHCCKNIFIMNKLILKNQALQILYHIFIIYIKAYNDTVVQLFIQKYT